MAQTEQKMSASAFSTFYDWETGPPVPLVVHHLFGLARTELQVVVVARCASAVKVTDELILILNQKKQYCPR